MRKHGVKKHSLTQRCRCVTPLPLFKQFYWLAVKRNNNSILNHKEFDNNPYASNGKSNEKNNLSHNSLKADEPEGQ